MATSSIFANVKITDPKKAEAFINAMDAAANSPKKTLRQQLVFLLMIQKRLKRCLWKEKSGKSNKIVSSKNTWHYFYFM